MRLELVRNAREPEEIQKALDAFLCHHQLPDDIDILYKAMQHPNEGIVRDALGQVASLLMQGRYNGSLLLEDRLKEIEGRATEQSTKLYIEGIRAQVTQRKNASTTLPDEPQPTRI